MPPKQRDEKKPEPAIQDDRHRAAVIGEQVLLALGKPADRHRVDVRPLWQGRYRVNVLVGPDAVTLRVAHSYFLVTDDDGKVLGATPTIAKLY